MPQQQSKTTHAKQCNSHAIGVRKRTRCKTMRCKEPCSKRSETQSSREHCKTMRNTAKQNNQR
eukprot:6635483-Pyramimonas_sp.AAC.1